jgi:hypothetical protein
MGNKQVRSGARVAVADGYRPLPSPLYLLARSFREGAVREG